MIVVLLDKSTEMLIMAEFTTRISHWKFHGRMSAPAPSSEEQQQQKPEMEFKVKSTCIFGSC